MSDNIDFKALWNRQEVSRIPDIKQLIERAGKVKRKALNKAIGLNLVLLATAALILWVGFNIDNERFTTKIGIALVTIAIISFLGVYNQVIPLLFKTHPDVSSHDYLNQLISIKRKQEFVNKIMIHVYFVLLSVGLALYMWQFAMRVSTGKAILWYGLTFAWIAFAWLYLRPRRIKKKQGELNEVIAKLQEVDDQLKAG